MGMMGMGMGMGMGKIAYPVEVRCDTKKHINHENVALFNLILVVYTVV